MLRHPQMLRAETVELMTRINRLSDDGAEDGMQFGLGIQIRRTKKPTPAISDSALAWGGLLGAQDIVDPQHDLIILFYQNMQGPERLHPQFYERAYRLFDAPATPSAATPLRVSTLEGVHP